ncbi:MMPL family transporter [Salinisphaera hydrothermalis]|uniref:MMPL family transporter n=1 Tax=Salinisphaera hydrothermalis TaxID=563188 RepID=UPI003341B248
MKIRAALWLLGVIALGAILAGLAGSGRLTVRTDLMALLPTPQHDALVNATVHRMSTFGQRRVTVLLSGDTEAHRRRALQAMAGVLSASPAFDQVIARADDALSNGQRKHLTQLYFGHRFHLLAPADAKALATLAKAPAGSQKAERAREYFTNRAEGRLYGLGVGGGGRFVDDPFGLAEAYQRATLPNPAPNLRIAGDGTFYVVDKQGQRIDVMFAETRDNPFSLASESQATTALRHARAAAQAAAPKADIRISGVVRHAAVAAKRAKFEMSVIGTGSLIGIIVLMLWAFGRVRPFVLSLAAVGGGILLAAVVTDVVFGSIHMLTLVFGTSLVGVSIDYCLHFFAQRLATPDPATALARVRRPVLLGLVTSVIAYGGMVIAPFPGLRQIAVFTATGLIGGWLGMLLLLPGAGGPAPRPGRALRLAGLWRSHGPSRLAIGHERRLIAGLSGLAIVLGGFALWQLSPDDSVRVLYNPPPQLLKTDRQVANLLGSTLSTHAVVVTGSSPAQVLSRETTLVDQLHAGPRPAAAVRAITDAYPPVAAQKANYARLADTLYAPHGPMAQILAQAGFKPGKITEARQAFSAAHGHTLSLSDWLASPASLSLRGLWLGRVDGRDATIIRIDRINDAARFHRIVSNHSNAEYIDSVARISSLLSHYRRLATWLLGLEYILAWLVLWRAFGARGALALLLPPALASIVVLAIFAATGATFALFNLVALILLLGLGADYGIFLRTAPANHAPAMLAVGLSVATTLLAFGLLGLSHTPALHEFGLTLALGLTLTFLLASLLGRPAADTATSRPD